MRREFAELDGHDAYELLGVAPDASADEIKRAHIARVREHHPDRFQEEAAKAEGAAKTRLLNAARDVLTDRRAGYDAYRAPAAPPEEPEIVNDPWASSTMGRPGTTPPPRRTAPWPPPPRRPHPPPPPPPPNPPHRRMPPPPRYSTSPIWPPPHAAPGRPADGQGVSPRVVIGIAVVSLTILVLIVVVLVLVALSSHGGTRAQGPATRSVPPPSMPLS